MRTGAKTEPARVSCSWSSRYALTGERKAPEQRGATIRREDQTIHRFGDKVYAHRYSPLTPSALDAQITMSNN